MNLNLPNILLAAAMGLGMIALLAPLAIRVGLEDKPCQRKIHDGHIPLIGGIAIYLVMAVLLISLPDQKIDRELLSFLAAGGLLVAVGVVDDRFGLNVRLRIFIEAAAASIMVFGAGLWISNLGNLLAFGEVYMPFWIAYPFSLIAVFGIINAFNMIDGMDGLAGGAALIAIATLLAVTSISPVVNSLAPLILGGLAAFLLCNLQLLPFMPKVFLGDAGSKLVGLTLVWFLISTAQGGNQNQGGIEPVTALYIVGLPLFDMVATTIRRGRRGVSPFEPDRTHIHHILQALGFGKQATILSVLGLALSVNLLGVIFSLSGMAEAVQFAIFFVLYLVYACVTGRLLKRSQEISAPNPGLQENSATPDSDTKPLLATMTSPTIIITDSPGKS